MINNILSYDSIRRFINDFFFQLLVGDIGYFLTQIRKEYFFVFVILSIIRKTKKGLKKFILDFLNI